MPSPQKIVAPEPGMERGEWGITTLRLEMLQQQVAKTMFI